MPQNTIHTVYISLWRIPKFWIRVRFGRFPGATLKIFTWPGLLWVQKKVFTSASIIRRRPWFLPGIDPGAAAKVIWVRIMTFIRMVGYVIMTHDSHMTNDSHMIKMILIYDHHDNLSTLIDSSSFWTAPMKWQRPRSVPKSLAPQSNIWRIIILIVIRFSSFWPKSSWSSSSSSPAFPPNRCRAPFVHTCTGTSAETRTSPSKFSDHNMISCSKQLVLVLLGSLVSVTYYFRGTLCQICQKILAGVRPPPHS